MKKTYLIFLLLFFIVQVARLSFASPTDKGNLSAAEVGVTVEQVLGVLDANYVYPEMAERMRGFVIQQVRSGAYGGVLSQKALIERLQTDLREVSKDGHISLHLAKDAIDRISHIGPKTQLDLDVESSLIDGVSDQKIGYLRFNSFSGAPQIKSGLVDAMKKFESSDALIIDLRNNGGGDPSVAAFLASYFVDQDTLLWSVLDRDGNSVLDAISVDVGQRYQGDVCILTAKKTYSAAEAFTYTLKHLARACVVGESSGGGAHLVDMQRVNDDIDIRIPVLRAYNPITESNWEGVGVIPTIEVQASTAKTAAFDYLKNRIN